MMVIRRGATWVCGAMGCSLCRWGGVVCNSGEWVGCYMRGQSGSCGPRVGGQKGDSIVGEVGSECVEEGERDKDRHGGYEIHRPLAS